MFSLLPAEKDFLWDVWNFQSMFDANQRGYRWEVTLFKTCMRVQALRPEERSGCGRCVHGSKC